MSVPDSYRCVTDVSLDMPLITQSDRGTENVAVAKAQTILCQSLDASLEGTIQHQWKPGHNNIKPEIAWSQMRRRFAPEFEKTLDEGLNDGTYDPGNVIQK